MTPSLPVSRVVAVSVTLTPQGAQAQSLSNMLLMGTSAVIDPVERYRSYADLGSVAADFGTAATEYLAASKWFAQAPQPTELIVGRWLNAASTGGLRGATLSAAQQALANFTVITTGAFKVAKNGGALTDVTGLNFAGAANLNAVAAIIQAAAGMSGTTVVWNSNYQRFEFTSTTTGITSAISFLATPGTGTDISTLLGGTAASSGAYIFQGAVAETAVSAVALMDNMIGQQFYGLNVPDAVDADDIAIAGLVEGLDNKHTYWITTNEAAVLVANLTTDIAYQMKLLGYQRTFIQFSSSDPNAVMSAAARILTTNFRGNSTVITLKFKQQPGVAAENLNTSQANSAKAKNANVFANYNNSTAIIQEGVMSSGVFCDIVTGTDWLAVTIQNALYNLLYTSTTKIPQTDGGMQLLTTECERVCGQGVINGLLAPGVWNANGFGILNQGDYLPKGFYVYAASVDTQDQSDRAARMAMPIQIAAKLAGAIHFVDVAITVNQ